VGALRRRAPGFPGPITDGTPITDDGLGLDSLALMDLLAEIEAALGVALRDDDIQPATMGTVGRLLRLVHGRLAEPVSGQRPPAQ
jgi:acyl carrier protein